MKNGNFFKKIIFTAAVLGTGLLVSCREETKVANTAGETAEETTTGTNRTTIDENTTNSQAVNPQHGQPGHRCDIPVGAPLNSKKNVSTGSQPASGTPIDPSNSPATNPPHGQPGHDCTKPVGAPLN